jgi:hypothetical protein
MWTHAYHAAPADIETSAIVLDVHGVEVSCFPIEELEDVNELCKNTNTITHTIFVSPLGKL